MSFIPAPRLSFPSLLLPPNMSSLPLSAPPPPVHLVHALQLPLWDFHGSVHTATLAVCTVLVIFILLLGTGGNGLVLLSAANCWNRATAKLDKVLVLNLAAADFLVCSCLAPVFLYLLFSRHPAGPSREFCGGFLFASTACGLLSLLSLVAIALHRQSRVRGRVKHTSGKATAGILATVYAVSVGTAAGGTAHVFLATETWEERDTCRAVMDSVTDATRNNVVLFFISPVVVVCFVVILVSYVVIARAVRMQSHLRVKSLQPALLRVSVEPDRQAKGDHLTPAMSTDRQSILQSDAMDCSQSAPPSPHRATSGHVKLRCHCCSCLSALDKEKKAVTMCLVVVLILALSWAPLVVSHVVELLAGCTDSIVLYQVKLCGVALIFLNSALDPYIYAQPRQLARGARYPRNAYWAVLRACRNCSSRLQGPEDKRKFRTLPTDFRSVPGQGRSQAGNYVGRKDMATNLAPAKLMSRGVDVRLARPAHFTQLSCDADMRTANHANYTQLYRDTDMKASSPAHFKQLSRDTDVKTSSPGLYTQLSREEDVRTANPTHFTQLSRYADAKTSSPIHFTHIPSDTDMMVANPAHFKQLPRNTDEETTSSAHLSATEGRSCQKPTHRKEKTIGRDTLSNTTQRDMLPWTHEMNCRGRHRTSGHAHRHTHTHRHRQTRVHKHCCLVNSLEDHSLIDS